MSIDYFADHYRNIAFKYKHILCFLSLLCVAFAVFDGFRGTQYKPYFPFAFLRDLSVFVGGGLGFFIIAKIKIQKSFALLVFLQIFICAYSFFTSFLVSDKAVFVRQLTLGGGIGFWSKMLSMICICFLTYAYIYVSGKKAVEKIFKCFIYCSFLYSLLTIILYLFLPSLYASLPRQWYGRISIGYPTQDVYVLAISLVLLLENILNKTLSILISAVNVSCIIMQNTFTGYILIVFVFFIYFIRFGFFSKALILSLGFFLLMFVFYIYKNYEVFGNFGVLIKVKADSLILGGTDDPSFYLRLQQIAMMMKSLFSDWIFVLFGYGGIGGFSVESGVYSTLAFSGVLGIIIYVFTILYFLFLSIKNKSFILFSIPSMYILSSFSISPIYLMSTYWTLGFLIAYQSFVDEVK
ncbi:TPA: hypothetical protein L9K38_000419 [Klebsiella pneumoniae]|nr:hypothetical protein [Klebsiella pneumoniae]AVG04619.1 hypothetical protein AL516_09235 [Klebsiella pneumoniae]EIV3901802.1 hypothetical protein [Klebsiella pneumoniae]EIV3928472.1 hypothetical protein [Klebsiella pneumoniae]EIW3892830.1 hypothetical protein [Klebsiella pneumoniae]EIW5940396.1 hypothetical protein [Klebsiella pneumoniae]